MPIVVNKAALSKAKKLVSEGKVDSTSEWSFSAEDGNKLLGPEGDNWTEYAAWHLAEDTDATEKTKARYKYPFGKNGKVYKRALDAIRSYASKEGETDIFTAAGQISKSLKKSQSDNYRDHVDIIQMDSMAEPFAVTPEGYLKGRAVLTNIGVFPYMMPDGSIQRRLRLPEEVFEDESMRSLEMLPVTNNHPDQPVTVENINEVKVGFTGERVYRDEYHLSNTVVITDKETIAEVQAGKRALSCGYTAYIEEKSGNWMGIDYDAIQREIRYNHVSIVEKGRAGDAAKISFTYDRSDALIDVLQDSVTEKNNGGSTNMSLKKYQIDGIEYEADEGFIRRFSETQSELKTTKEALAATKTELQTAVAQKDSAIESKQELEAKTENMVDAKEAEAMAQRRVSLHLVAQRAKIDCKDMSEDEIKKAVIVAVFPKATEKVANADSAYIDARFDNAVEELDERDVNNDQSDKSRTEDSVAAHAQQQYQQQADSADAARQRQNDHDANAWKGDN